jgi:outer membrane protein TolC
MKNKYLLFYLAMFLASTIIGQQRMTLVQAQQYAVKNANSVTQATFDAELASIQTKQILSIGLPQVNGSVQFQNFLSLPTSVIPGAIFGQPGQDVKVQFGVPYQMNAGLSASQILFDGSWLVGLQASKAYLELSQLQIKRSEIEIKHQVAQSYHLAMIAKETIQLLEAGKLLIQKTLSESQALFKEGFIEEQNIDQLQLTLNDWNARINVALAQEQLTLDLLKFNMGMPIASSIELEDNTSVLSANISDALLSEKFAAEGNIEVQIMNKALGLQNLNVKAKQAAALPNFAAFYNYQKQALRREFNFADGNQDWFPMQLWGVQMNVPIFSGGGRYQNIQKAKVEVAKVSANAKLVREGALLAYNSARTNFMSALSNVNTNKASMELAEKIFVKTNQKYKEGLATSFELSQANNQVLQSQGSYVQSLLQLLNAKDQLQKALNQ